MVAAKYGDGRFAIQFVDCCHVAVSQLEIRGFGTGIDVRGHSKHHTYSKLTLGKHAVWGMRFGVNQEDEGLDYVDKDHDKDYYHDTDNASTLGDNIAALISDGDFPEFIEVMDCTFKSIGYDTSGADLMIGFLATNCTVIDSRFIGDRVRGLDGVELVGASHGHLIDGNTIYNHSKFCQFQSVGTERVYQAMFSNASGTSRLVHPCVGEASSHSADIDTGLGYVESWFDYIVLDRLGGAPPYDPDNDLSAFGENGIVLKAARPRTDDPNGTIHISNNIIYGNRYFAGITVYEGSQNVYIRGNRIFQNATGIAIWNTDNNAWYNDGDAVYYTVPTKDIYIFRNVIYMNRQYGIHVTSQNADVTRGPAAGTALGTAYPFEVSGVHVYRNTIAHNLWEGVRVMNPILDASGAPLSSAVNQVFLYHNVIARNGRWTEKETPFQVSWDKGIDLDPSTCWSDYNCYLGWASGASSWTMTWTFHGEWVYYWGAASGTAYGTIADASSSWGVEEHGIQAIKLTELDFNCYFLLHGTPMWRGLEGSDGDNVLGTVEESDPSDLESLDYSTGANSVCDSTSATSLPVLHVVPHLAGVQVVPGMATVPGWLPSGDLR